MRHRVGLPLVAAAEALTGVAPPLVERAARRAQSGDAIHRALLFTCVTVSRHAVTRCVPPSGARPLLDVLTAVENWADNATPMPNVQQKRADAFALLTAAELRAVESVRAMPARRPSRPTLLDPHADAIVQRYVGLAANYAGGAALLTADAVGETSMAASVFQQAAGAIAYQAVALRSARSVELRELACKQAEWEVDRPGAPPGHAAAALAVQLFHEFLGAQWKDYSDAHRAYLFDFASWALSPIAS